MWVGRTFLMVAAAVSGLLWAEAGARGQAVAPANLDRPRGTYVVQPPAPLDPVMSARGGNPQHRILFLNRNGGTYTSGWPPNSIANIQSISEGTWEMPPFAKGDTLWNQLMECSRLMWERFDIEVTDVDPGDVPHLECVVSGRPQDLGLGSGVGGISPITGNCSVLERAISFAFADLYGANMQLLCETVAQEVSHSLGLDHEFYCQDPMTYLGGCGNKWFQDVSAPCGEDHERQCRCGLTQNSVQALLARLGTSDAIPPSLSVVEPLWMATVHPAFPILLDASDNGRIVRVELWVNGEHRATAVDPPYTLHAPFDLPLGPATLEVRAIDGAVNTTSATLMVNIEAECSTAADCPGGDCANGRCGAALGGECSDHSECASGVCARPPGSFSLFCTQACDDGACPAGTACVEASNLCWAGDFGAEEGGGGGCETSQGRTLPGVGVALLFFALVVSWSRGRRSGR